MKQLPRTLFVGGLALSLSAMSAALHAQDNLGNLEALIFEASHSEVTMTDDGVARIGWTRADVPVIVEYLVNIRDIRGEVVDLVVAPLKIKAGDGAPVRCFAIEVL